MNALEPEQEQPQREQEYFDVITVYRSYIKAFQKAVFHLHWFSIRTSKVCGHPDSCLSEHVLGL